MQLIIEYLIRFFVVLKGLIRALAISNNDRYFASTANDTNVRLYETRTGGLLYTFTGRKLNLFKKSKYEQIVVVFLN